MSYSTPFLFGYARGKSSQREFIREARRPYVLSVSAAAAENKNDSKDNDPGAIIVKDVA